MTTTNKVTEIFCIIDELCKNSETELKWKIFRLPPTNDAYKR